MSWWKKIKNWVLERVEKALYKEVDKFDRYESELADLIRRHADPDQRAKQVVDYVQAQLAKLVEKSFDSKWLSRSFFGHVEDSILAEIKKLDKYETQLSDIVKQHLNPDEQSKVVVDYVQNYVKALIAKYIKKI